MPTGYETVNIHRAKFSGKTKLLLLPSSLHMFSLGICYECVPKSTKQDRRNDRFLSPSATTRPQ